ncbi:MAG: BON domain-containing protein [Dechloromonas sp.]|uniref:BON domain-containing protein n=1 Tax=Dechloromonas sp. CZR5 TaxID=2608630 RepID=UPI00123CAFA1|nr:BON domain-containing protein [Dechloromonas sp. CZR5]MBL8403121.1 BON domain-containing protein [Dechloromonas sp.]
MLKSNIYVVALVAAATFAGLGLSSAATDDPQVLAAMVANNEAQDAALGERVETLLRTDIGLAGSKIRVFSNAAVITVAGTVPDEHALRRALDLASGVRGVREVRNAMEVYVPK